MYEIKNPVIAKFPIEDEEIINLDNNIQFKNRGKIKAGKEIEQLIGEFTFKQDKISSDEEITVNLSGEPI